MITTTNVDNRNQYNFKNLEDFKVYLIIINKQIIFLYIKFFIVIRNIST